MTPNIQNDEGKVTKDQILAEYSATSAINKNDRLEPSPGLRKSMLNIKIVAKEIPSVPGVIESPNLSAREIIEQAKYETHMKTLMQEPKSNKEKLLPINLSFKVQEENNSHTTSNQFSLILL